MNSQGGYPHGNRPLLGDIVADLDRAERGESGVNMDKTITIPPDNSMLILNPDGRVSLNVCGRDNRKTPSPLLEILLLQMGKFLTFCVKL